MGAVTPIPSDIRAMVLKDIQENGLTIAEAAKKHNMHHKTVYNWVMRKSDGPGVSWGTYNKLLQENEQLKTIIGEMALNLSRSKKI